MTNKRKRQLELLRKLISNKNTKETDDAESRVDYIADHLGIEKSEVIEIVNLLKEENILADMKDLRVFMKKGASEKRLLSILKTFLVY